MDEPFSAYPEGAVQHRYASVGWIPLAYDWGGNHFGIDLRPGKAGTAGQIINFGRDEMNKYVMAPSLRSYLEWQLRQMNEGYVSVNVFKYGTEETRVAKLSRPLAENLLDAVPTLFGGGSRP